MLFEGVCMLFDGVCMLCDGVCVLCDGDVTESVLSVHFPMLSVLGY